MFGGITGGLWSEGTLFTIFTFEAAPAQRSLGNQEDAAPTDNTNVVVDANNYYKNIYK